MVNFLRACFKHKFTFQESVMRIAYCPALRHPEKRDVVRIERETRNTQYVS